MHVARVERLDCGMTLQQLRALVAVARAGTFGGAALDLGLSQAAVSQSVATLERDLGVRLFERGRHGARTTRVGRRIVEQAAQSLRLEEAMREEASLERGRLRGTLRIEAFPSASMHVLPPSLAHLAERHPELRVELRQQSDRDDPAQASVADLRASETDVAFVQLPVEDPSVLDTVLTWPLIEEPYVAIVARRHLTPGRDDRLDDDLLRRVPAVLDVLAPCSLVVGDYLERRLGDFEPRFRADDAAMIQLVATGAALGMLPRTLARGLPEGVATLEVDDPPRRTLSVAIAPTGLKVPAVRALLAHMAGRYPEAGLPPFPAADAAPAARDRAEA